MLIKYPNKNAQNSYNIPSSVTKIDSNAFAKNTNIIILTIPQSVNFIDDQAFASCEKLQAVTFEGLKEPSTCNSLAFYNTHISLKVFVPHNFEDEDMIFCNIPVTTLPEPNETN